MKRILIIEDDPAIADGLHTSLTNANYDVEIESDGRQGYTHAMTTPPDLIILDLVLPSMNGEDVCSSLRREGNMVPILMLTSKSDEIDKILGLELGADDYMTKPFSLRELQARIKVLLRRIPEAKPLSDISIQDLHLDMKTHEVSKGGKKLSLTVREFDILRFFVEHKNEVVTRDMLLDEVWGYDHFPTTRTVDNYILSLRKKIENNPSEPEFLVTIHTAGYKFVAP
ncbi:MAG: DNA-binding response regulator [Ectothiorhodospiraceae bacterium]|nr:DNA-binding response regulator [Ectothiorhodospiraceae bacterium]